MRFTEMPGWTRQLMPERAFRKAVIRAAKMETMEIAARSVYILAMMTYTYGKN